MSLLLLKSPSILHLFGPGCPTDIPRFVISVIINSVYGMSERRRISDVLVKGRKIFAPFFANGNASAAIGCVMGRVWIITSPLHSRPSSIDLRICRVLSMNIMSFSSSRDCLFKPALASNICVETSARFRVPPPQIFSNNPAIVPALTGAKPVTNYLSGLFPSRLELVGDGQPTKSFAT